eukprot:15479465-Alexandrium_andersonii.AAC.1
MLRRRHRHRVCVLKDIRRRGIVHNGREDQLAGSRLWVLGPCVQAELSFKGKLWREGLDRMLT